MINTSDIMISNKIETTLGNVFKITFFEKVIVDDFECRHAFLEAIVRLQSNDEFVILDNEGYSKDYINEHVEKANKTIYIVHYYDIENEDLKIEEMCGLKNIVNIIKSNNIIDIVAK